MRYCRQMLIFAELNIRFIYYKLIFNCNSIISASNGEKAFLYISGSLLVIDYAYNTHTLDDYGYYVTCGT